MSGQRLYAMLCVRARAEVREKLGKKLRKGGTLNDDAAYTIITYPTVSGAVAAVAALFASEPLAQDARFCLGVVEAHREELGGRTANVIRSLTDQAHPGQVLFTSAARDIARGNLPARLTLTRLGDVMVESEISAELTWQLSGAHIHRDFPDLPGLYQYRSNVPEGEPIIGRAEELRRALQLAGPGTLTTVVGPLGVGKTAFARYVASYLQNDLTDGALWVDVQTTQGKKDPFEFLNSLLKLAHSSEHSNESALLNRLRSSQLLIVLDGCDNGTRPWSALVASVLAECPEVSFLITNRTPFELPDENVIGLDPFPTPQKGTSLDEVEACEGVRLFLKIANLPPEKGSIDLAAEVLRNSAGLPLAIVLAAGRFADADKKAEAPSLYAPSLVHDSVANFVSWIVNDLPDDELDVLTTLSIVEETWTLPFALKVCTLGHSDPDYSKVLQRLINRRLIAPEPGFAGQRFRIMTVVRDHLLRNSPVNEAVEHSYFLASRDLLDEIRSFSSTGFDLIKREYHHFAWTLNWAVDTRSESAIEFMLSLGPYWIRRGPYKDALALCMKGVERILVEGFKKAKLLKLTGTIAGYAGDFNLSLSCLSQAATMFQCLNKKHDQASCLVNLAIHMRNTGDVSGAVLILEKAKAILGEEITSSKARMTASHLTLLFESFQFDKCEELLPDAAEQIYKSEDLWSQAALEFTMACLYLHKGNGALASEVIKSSIIHYRQVGDFQGLLCAIEKAAFLCIRHGEHSRAARLLGGTEAGFLSLGITRARDLTSERDKAIQEISDTLGFERAEHYITEGSKMRLDEITHIATLS